MDCVVFLTQQKTNEIKVHLKQTNYCKNKLLFIFILFLFFKDI